MLTVAGCTGKQTDDGEAGMSEAARMARHNLEVGMMLVAVIVYQRWQIGDKNATLGRFIDENEKLRRRIERAGIV